MALAIIKQRRATRIVRFDMQKAMTASRSGQYRWHPQLIVMLRMILKEKGTSTFTPYSLPSSSQLNIREAISKFWLDCEQADIHLVKFEGILFSAVAAGY